MIEFTIFGDSSFAPSGKHSQSGFTIHLTHHDVRHLVHWQSLREPKTAESSAESELYALATARKATRNMRLLLHESFTSSLTLSLRCDNTAACLGMMEESAWRTWCVSIYGEAARHEISQGTVILTYVSSDRQLAAPLTKPTSAWINSTLPSVGLSCLKLLTAISGAPPLEGEHFTCDGDSLRWCGGGWLILLGRLDLLGLYIVLG